MTYDATAIVRAQLADAPTALLLEEIARRLAGKAESGKLKEERGRIFGFQLSVFCFPLSPARSVVAYPIEVTPFDSERAPDCQVL